MIGIRDIAEKVRPPRAVHLKWPFGHPFGEVDHRIQQRSVIHYALHALGEIQVPGTIRDPGWAWRRQQYAEPAEW